jgi:hypothetical protein
MKHSLEAGEVKARLDGIVGGPWKDQSKRAFKFLAPKADLKPLLARIAVPVACLSTVLAGQFASRKHELETTLQAHWKDSGGIEDPKAIAKRDAFDEALTELQLMELAVEMGYLPLEAVRDEARERLANLLWSTPAREFVRAYDYLSVYYLATRVGVDIGQGALEPPSVKTTGTAQYATVLAEHKRWYEDPAIKAWLGFLDDYITFEDEHDVLEKYMLEGRDRLEHASAAQRKRIELVAAGSYAFVVRLSGIFDLLEHEERARVGLIYAYWLGKFFGYDLGDDGYKKVDDGWVKGATTWATSAIDRNRARYIDWQHGVFTDAVTDWATSEIDGDLKTKFEKVWDSRIEILHETWEGVIALEHSVRAIMDEQDSGMAASAGLAFLQIEDVTLDEWSAIAPKDSYLWEPARPRPARSTPGVLSVAGEGLDSIRKFLAEKYARDGELRIQLVDHDGSVTPKTLKGLKSHVLTNAEALLEIDKLGLRAGISP